jgi:glutamate-1-semialdehyde 2,1-aminomutase
MIVASGSGATIQDVDGKSYIDYCMSWGSLILGHAPKPIVDAAMAQMQKGSSFGIATEVELLLADKIVHLVPSLEKIRFVSSGTEATMTALRLSRGFTGRRKIIKFIGHYHGHSDALLVQAGSGASSMPCSLGVNQNVIEDTFCLPFNDLEGLKSFFRTHPSRSDVAAVILEPITGNMGVVEPLPHFLETLREETKRNGTLLIFDEVITGFRVGLQGVQGLYGIDPDLTCFGKIIGGGFPAAAVGGKAAILNCLAPLGGVYQAGTLSGNPVAMRAGLTALSILEMPCFFENLEEMTDLLTKPLQRLLSKNGSCLQQVGSMFSCFLGLEKVTSYADLSKLDFPLFARFFRHLFERGIYIPPHPHEAWFLSTAHTKEQIAYTLESIESFF